MEYMGTRRRRKWEMDGKDGEGEREGGEEGYREGVVGERGKREGGEEIIVGVLGGEG